MSFPKSKLKRFNELGSCAPPPGHYNPNTKGQIKGGVIDGKSTRFTVDKDKLGLPGPGAHDVSVQSVGSNLSGCVPIGTSTPHKSLGRQLLTKELRNAQFSQSTGSLCPQLLEPEQEVSFHTEKIIELNNQVSSLEAQIDQQNAKIGGHCQEIEQLKEQLQTAHENVKRLTEELEEARQAYTELKSLLQDAEHERDQHRHLLEKRTDELNEMTDKLKKAEQHEIQLQQEQQQKTEEIDELKKMRKHLENEILDIKAQEDIEVLTIQQNCEKEKAKLAEELQIVMQQSQTHQQLVEQLESNNNCLEQQVSRLEKELKTLKLETLERDDIIRHLKEEVFTNEYESETESQQAPECEETEPHAGLALQEYKELVTCVKDLKDREQVVDTSLRRMTDQCLELQELYNEFRKEKHKAVSLLKKELEVVKLSLHEKEEERQCLESLNTHILQTRTVDQHEVDSLKDRARALEQKLEKEKSKNNSLQERLTNAEHTIYEVKRQEQSAMEQLTVLRADNARLTDVNVETEERMVDLELVQQRLEANVNYLTQMNVELEDAQRMSSTERDELTKQLEKLTADRIPLLEIQKESDKMVETTSKLRDEVTTLQSNNTALKLEVEHLSGENAALAQEATKLRKSNQAMEERMHTQEEQKQIALQTEEFLNENVARWRKLYEDLQAKVAPFQEQLDKYELEKNFLLNKQQHSDLEMNKLSQQYAQLLGHQNQKQKIHHVVKLKQENNSLKEEVLRLRDQLCMQKKKASQLEDTLKATQGKRRFDPCKAFTHSTTANTTLASSRSQSKENINFPTGAALKIKEENK